MEENWAKKFSRGFRNLSETSNCKRCKKKRLKNIKYSLQFKQKFTMENSKEKDAKTASEDANIDPNSASKMQRLPLKEKSIIY